MSSPYAVLGDRPIDQWKVTELKEELKRRKLITKGLKEDLVKRLDEAVRNENEDTQINDIATFDSVSQPEAQAENSVIFNPVADTTGDVIDNGENITDSSEVKNETVDHGNSEIIHQKDDTDMVMVSESTVFNGASSGQDLKNGESEIKCEVSNSVQDILDSKSPHEEAKVHSSDVNVQVADVSQVISDSISIDTVSVTDKNELKDSVVADYVNLEVDVKHERPLFINTVEDGDNLQSVDIYEPRLHKLNLDRSSGDDSMEEDLLESKQVDLELGCDDIVDKSEKVEVSVVKEDVPFDAMVEDITTDTKIVNTGNQNDFGAASVKRKLHEQEAAGSSDITKRQRRWNSEGLKVSEPLGVNISAFNTPKDAVQPTIKRNFIRSNSVVSDESPKERVVPPSPKSPTNSLRIDRFLRPFTLKAVQDLLGKTGSIVSFWMDNIKTHCYVSYSSIEEAVETRNAVYNLQWPTNGGRLLLAEFVDPQEVKHRVEVPPPSPATPVALPPPPQSSPRLQVQKQHLPPPPPPPPPPLSNPLPARERLLPAPPPLPEKVDPPIVTLDDLFRKTKATPRIYYLPLSEEQVAAKLKAHGKTVKQ